MSVTTVSGQGPQHALISLQSTGTGATFRHRTFKSLKFEDAGEKEAVTDAQGEIIAYVIKPRKTGPGQLEFNMPVSVGLTLASTITRRLRCMVQKEAFESEDNQDPRKRT